MFLHWQENGFQLSLTKTPSRPSRAANVSVGVAGMRYSSSTWGRACRNGDLKRESCRVHQHGFDLPYRYEKVGLEVTAQVEMPEGLEVLCQRTSVKNTGKEPVRLTRLACANVTGIGLEGTPWYESDRFWLHYCTSGWQVEGQWHTRPLRELNLMPGSSHDFEMHTFRIQSYGSWSTGEYYPLFVLEDREKAECYFFEREGAQNWFMELSACGGGDPELTVCLGGMDEPLGWVYALQPGETYTSPKAVYGVVHGGFEQAIGALTAYKRRDSAVPTELKVTFNDYMNCLWARPSEKRLLPLIDRAAELGVKRFCMDDGWAIPGTWDPLEERYGAYGFDGIVRYIRQKGMEPGIWFEFERTNPQVASQFKDDFVVRRDGIPLGEDTPKLNLCCPEARQYLLDKIDRVYRAGIRFIKNDHNTSEGWGMNISGESPAEGLVKKEQAFSAFIGELYARYPDLTIENCASGAMRCDHGTLRNFALQSLSDQENYLLFPSILIGQMACIPPEKAGIWSYPYPCPFGNLPSLELTEAQLSSHRDGRETVFNMVSAMMGHMYLSGRMDLADAENLAKIREGISLYQSYMETIPQRYPVFPAGRKPIYDRSFHALGLDGEEDMLLAVWALEEQTVHLELSPYGYATAEIMYPSGDGVDFSYAGGSLYLHFPEKNSAVLMRLSGKEMN